MFADTTSRLNEMIYSTCTLHPNTTGQSEIRVMVIPNIVAATLTLISTT